MEVTVSMTNFTALGKAIEGSVIRFDTAINDSDRNTKNSAEELHLYPKKVMSLSGAKNPSGDRTGYFSVILGKPLPEKK